MESEFFKRVNRSFGKVFDLFRCGCGFYFWGRGGGRRVGRGCGVSNIDIK